MRSKATRRPARPIREEWQVYKQGEWRELINRKKPIKDWVSVNGRLDRTRERLI